MARAQRSPVVELVARLAATRGPVLTWYSVAGERVELSGPVLVQWAAKVSHLLLDLGAEPGERVLVDLGADWRAPLVWLAAWWDGLSLVAPDGPGAAVQPGTVQPGTLQPGTLRAGTGTADYAVVREDRLTSADLTGVPADCLVVVARGALAPRVAHLPPGATDFATVRSFPDQAPPAAEESVVIPELAAGAGQADPAGRILLGPDTGPRELAAVWSRGGSVVWHDGLDPAALGRVVDNEGVG